MPGLNPLKLLIEQAQFDPNAPSSSSVFSFSPPTPFFLRLFPDPDRNPPPKPPNSSLFSLAMKSPRPRPPAGKHGFSQKPPNSAPSFHKPPSSAAPPSQKFLPSGPNSSFKPSSSNKPGTNQSRRGKSRWESPSKASKGKFPSSSSPATIPPNPKTVTPPISSSGPLPPHPHAPPPTFSLPPPPPPYGFQNLDRRTIVLADGSVRSYFALPPDELIVDPYGPPGGPGLARFPPPVLPHMNQFSPENLRRPGPHTPPLDGPSSHYEASIGKRKYGSEEDELARQRMHVLQYGNPNLGERNRERVSKQARIGEHDRTDSSSNNNRRLFDVNKKAVRKSFLKFIRMIYENTDLKKKYMENGRSGPLHCFACARASKEYKDLHELITHSFNFSQSQSQDERADHLGLHKALCVLMGWNYENAPDNNKIYQVLSREQAQANRDDLILWPPTVIIHNTSFGKRKDGRFEGFSNKDMDNILKDLGFPGGKARSIYSREGHMGVTCVQFSNTESGLKEAESLKHYFERQNHERKGWMRVRPVKPSEDDDRNPLLVKKDERTGEKKRVLYGYMASVADLDLVDVDIRKRASVKSRKDFDYDD
ncbi:hypothetical protein LUZ60_005570 [Juncus effusus]|nr:hypothetical protein LUZ60_005570 [Juncus effusus]